MVVGELGNGGGMWSTYAEMMQFFPVHLTHAGAQVAPFFLSFIFHPVALSRAFRARAAGLETLPQLFRCESVETNGNS